MKTNPAPYNFQNHATAQWENEGGATAPALGHRHHSHHRPYKSRHAEFGLRQPFLMTMDQAQKPGRTPLTVLEHA